MTNLRKRGMEVDPGCPICRRNEEMVVHALFGYWWAKDIWLSPFPNWGLSNLKNRRCLDGSSCTIKLRGVWVGLVLRREQYGVIDIKYGRLSPSHQWSLDVSRFWNMRLRLVLLQRFNLLIV